MTNIHNRLTALISAAAIGCYAMLGTGAVQAAAKFLPVGSAAPSVQGINGDTPLVSVVVKLHGDAVLATDAAAGQGTDFIGTSEAEAIQQQLSQERESAEAALRALYPALEVGYQYDLLLNGFSCELPKHLIARAEALPQIERIMPVVSYSAPEPSLYDAPDLAGAGSFYNKTGAFGQNMVVCVLDSELDLSHPMFAPLPDTIPVELDTADISGIVKTLPKKPDATQVYRSTKVPYAYDYADDTPYDVSDPGDYHGTHVCGIAAGNAYTDADGVTVSGLARDAQLVFMKVFKYYDDVERYYAYNDVMAAALEDAVRLKADVINMSIGSPDQDVEDVLYLDAVNALENAGIILCASAGNTSDRVNEDGKPNFAENIDYGTVQMPSVIPSAFSIASADNAFREEVCLELTGSDVPVRYIDCGLDGFSDTLGTGKLEYVDCGHGAAEEFDSGTVTGKLALVERGTLTTEEIVANATDAGAVGLIFVNPSDSDLYLLDRFTTLPSLVITHSDGELLRNAGEHTITVDPDNIRKVAVPAQISVFSSYGVGENLCLKPDITGIGGNVMSAAIGGGLDMMSGTSMASPFVAGAAAVLEEHMTKSGTLPEGNRARTVRNVLMNSAKLYTDENGLYVSPRRQGAGLVDLDAAQRDKVILTCSSVSGKIELFDGLSDTFDFDVHMQNLSQEDVTFTGAKLVLSTDAAEYSEQDGGYIISGTQSLTSTADVSALRHIAAGESRTETVHVALDAAQTAKIREIFTNGFFVEGYLVLEGAENCCDISIPLLGFAGDWGAVPIFDTAHRESSNCASVMIGQTRLNAQMQNAQALIAEMDFIDTIPDSVLSQGGAYDILGQIWEYEADPANGHAGAKAPLRDTVYISPDGDMIADQLLLPMQTLREARVGGAYIYDADGRLIGDSYETYTPSHEEMVWIPDIDLTELPEGSYFAAMTGSVFYYGAQTQELRTPFVIDRTRPQVTSEIREENGRKLMTITMQDQSLEGVYILGNGKGGQVGSDHKTYTGKQLQLALKTTSDDRYSYFNWITDDTYTVYDNGWMRLIANGAYNSDVEALSDYAFVDIIIPEPDENGKATLVYDITDLTDYTITVMDKAFHAEVIEEQMGFDGFDTGVWEVRSDNMRYYCFETPDRGTLYYQNGDDSRKFTFAVGGVGPNFRYDGIDAFEAFDVRKLSPTTFLMKWEDETEEIITRVNGLDPAKFHYFTDKEIAEWALDDYARQNDYRLNDYTLYHFDGEVYVDIQQEDGMNGGMETVAVYILDPLTGKGLDGNALPVDMMKVTDAALGDINQDGSVNASDAADVLIAAAKIGAGTSADLTDEQVTLADVNKDGSINASDAAVILQYAAAVGSGASDVTIEKFI